MGKIPFPGPRDRAERIVSGDLTTELCKAPACTCMEIAPIKEVFCCDEWNGDAHAANGGHRANRNHLGTVLQGVFSLRSSSTFFIEIDLSNILCNPCPFNSKIFTLKRITLTVQSLNKMT